MGFVESYYYPHRDGRPNKRIDRVHTVKKNGKQKKAFFQKEWDPSSNSWVNGTASATRVLYRADEITRFSESTSDPWTLIICEGEKDVRNLRNLDLGIGPYEVTTLCQGAKAADNWEDSHTEDLRAFGPAAVFVIGDRDELGIAHVRNLCAKISPLGFPVQAFMPSPHLGDDGADISDHLGAGYDWVEMERARDLEPAPPPMPGISGVAMVIPPNVGIPIEQYNWIQDVIREDVMFCEGTDEPWFMREGDTSVLTPSTAIVAQRFMDEFYRRYVEMENAGAGRGELNRLRSHCKFGAAIEAMNASKAALYVPLSQITEHRENHLIAAPNYVIDLASGNPLAHSKRYRFTKVTGVEYDPDAKCPKFLKMFEEAQPDPVMRDWIHRVMGSGITGDQEQVIIIFVGRGADSKSTFTNCVKHVLGDYAVTTKSDTWMRSRFAQAGEKPRPDKLRLLGCRTVFTSETPHDGLLDEVAVKGFVGGDEIVERTLHRRVLPFRPQGTLVFVTNNPMRLMDSSLGMRRRVRYVRWNSSVPAEKQILNLDQKILREEAAGILAWLVRGAQAYISRGILPVPPSVQAATDQYLDNEDDLAEFITEKIDTSDPDGLVMKSDVHSAFTEWAKDRGFPEWSQQKLTRELSARGFLEHRTATARCFSGVRLRPGK